MKIIQLKMGKNLKNWVKVGRIKFCGVNASIEVEGIIAVWP